jgi:hypothetical protein
VTQPLDPATWRYNLSVLDQQGRRLAMPHGSLVWTENADNLAAEMRTTIPNLPFRIGNETINPWDAFGAGTPVYLSVVPRGGVGTARADITSSATLGMPWDPGYVGPSELGAGIEVFQGIVLEVSASTGNPLALEIMARDILHYLLLTDIDFAVTEEMPFREALKQLTQQWGIELGRVDGPDVKLGEYSTGNEIKSAGDVLAELLDQANFAGAGMYLARATAGKLEIISPGLNHPVYELRAGGGAGSSSVRVSITDLVEEVEVFAEDQKPPDEDGKTTEDPLPPAPPEGSPAIAKGTSGKVLPLRRMSGASSHAGFSGARKRIKVQGISYFRGQSTIDLPAGVNGGQFPDAVGVSGAAGAGGNGAQYSDAQRYALAMAAGFNSDEAITMAAISTYECQSCDLSTVNASGDMGLWQINKVHWDRYGGQAALVNPANSARAAYGIYSERGGGERGFTAWCVYPGG